MHTACTPLLQQIQPTNPWAEPCPQPVSFTVNDFLLKNNTISLKVTYDSDAGIDLICPNRVQDYYESYSDGVWDLSCDVDGLARVITDGKGWVWVGQNHFCDYFTGYILVTFRLKNFIIFLLLGFLANLRTGAKAEPQRPPAAPRPLPFKEISQPLLPS